MRRKRAEQRRGAQKQHGGARAGQDAAAGEQDGKARVGECLAEDFGARVAQQQRTCTCNHAADERGAVLRYPSVNNGRKTAQRRPA